MAIIERRYIFSIIFGIYSSNFGGVAFFLGGGLHQKSSNDEIQSAKNLQREREMSKIYQTSWPGKTVTKGVEVILEVEVKMVATRAIPVLLLIQCFSVTAPNY